MKKLKSLTDKEYDNLKEFARNRGMRISGYQYIGGYISLNNSVHDGLVGETIPKLKSLIIKFTTK